MDAIRLTEDDEIADLVDRTKIQVVQGHPVQEYLDQFAKWQHSKLTKTQAIFLTRQFKNRGAGGEFPVRSSLDIRHTKRGTIWKNTFRKRTITIREEKTIRGKYRYRNLDTGKYVKKPRWVKASKEEKK